MIAREEATSEEEEATSAQIGFHAGALLSSNWNLEMSIFVVRRKTAEHPEKNPRSKARTNNKLNAHICSHMYCANPTPALGFSFYFYERKYYICVTLSMSYSLPVNEKEREERDGLQEKKVQRLFILQHS